MSEEEKPRRKGPSDFQLSIGGLIGVLGLAASGITTYNGIQNDLTSLKRGETYQERTNDRLSAEIRMSREEHRETMREFNEKLDRIIENWPNQRRR